MPDLQSIQAAFMAADAAGDTASAQALHDAIVHMQAAPAGPAHPTGGHSFDMVNGQPVPTGSDEAHAAMQPTAGMSAGEKMAAGAGQSVYQTGRGLEQLGDMAADKMLGGNRLQQDQAAETDARARDFSLDHDKYGVMGNIAGNVGQMVVGGSALKGLAGAGRAAQLASKYSAAAPLLTNTGMGVAMGAAAPTAGDGERLQNAALGGLGAGVGNVLGRAGSAVLRTGSAALSEGAQAAARIGQQHGIDLTLPQLSQSKFVKLLQSVTSELPGSGAGKREAAQKSQFNNAVGKPAGIPNAEGAIGIDNVGHAMDTVGDEIGQLAGAHSPIPQVNHMQDMFATLQDARDNATPEVYQKVANKVTQLFAHADPQTGEIPGNAWRQANTALQRQIRSEQDGDTRHYLGQLQGTYMDIMHDSMHPDDAAAFDTARSAYRNLKTIQPLAEKAGDEGIRPIWLQSRAIAAKNNRGDYRDLGDLGKYYIADRTPNSTTATREMMLKSLGALGLGSMVGGYEGHEHGDTGVGAGVGAIGAMLAGGVGNRALNGKLIAKYAAMQNPGLGKLVNPALSRLPQAGATAAIDSNEDAAAPASFNSLVQKFQQ